MDTNTNTMDTTTTNIVDTNTSNTIDTTTSNTMDTNTSNSITTTTISDFESTTKGTMESTSSNSDDNGESVVKGAHGTKSILRDRSEEVVIRLPAGGSQAGDLVEEEVLAQEELMRGTRDGWFVVAKEVRKERSTVRKRQTVSFHDVVEETMKQDKQDRQSTSSEGVGPLQGFH